MENTRPVFDVARHIDVRLIRAEGDATVTVRFPSDEQIQRRQRARKMVIKDLGRGVTDTEITPNEDADLKILNEIKVEGPEVDGAEALYILDLLTDVDVVDVEREGGAFRVSLKVPGAVTEHLIAIPTRRQIQQQRRDGTKVLNLPFGKKEVRVNLGASADLYETLCKEKEGYASAVPVSHKAAAVNGALTALDREHTAEMEDPAENF